MTGKTKDELVHMQAVIRERQRDRIDQLHAISHEMERDAYRALLRGQLWHPKFLADLKTQHDLQHQFMRGMDEAVLIHEAIAVLEGRDPREVNGALWPVRSKPAELVSAEEL